jgi:hypothetical protein
VCRPRRPFSLAVKLRGRDEQWAGGELLRFADKPADAPVIHFNGTLTLRVHAETGVLHVPINYDQKPGWYDTHPPEYERRTLVRGAASELYAQVGTPGLGRGTFAAMSAGIPPADAHPVAEIEFPPQDRAAAPLRARVSLSQRCCGTLFHAAVRVPEGAAAGRAKVVLTYAEWKEAKVMRATGEMEVTDPRRRD